MTETNDFEARLEAFLGSIAGRDSISPAELTDALPELTEDTPESRKLAVKVSEHLQAQGCSLLEAEVPDAAELQTDAEGEDLDAFDEEDVSDEGDSDGDDANDDDGDVERFDAARARRLSAESVKALDDPIRMYLTQMGQPLFDTHGKCDDVHYQLILARDCYPQQRFHAGSLSIGFLPKGLEVEQHGSRTTRHLPASNPDTVPCTSHGFSGIVERIANRLLLKLDGGLGFVEWSK